jgi:Tfp pilus assembly protein PilX
MRTAPIQNNGIRNRFVLTSEDGSVMIVALALLMLLTLIGISATTTSMIELQIAGAKKTHTDHLFLAEGAAMQGVQSMEDDPSLLTNTTFVNDKDTVTQDDVRNLTFTRSQNSSLSTSGTAYAATDQGVVGSLKMGQPNLHSYLVYGWHDTPQGRVIVELGYRRAF